MLSCTHKLSSKSTSVVGKAPLVPAHHPPRVVAGYPGWGDGSPCTRLPALNLDEPGQRRLVIAGCRANTVDGIVPCRRGGYRRRGSPVLCPVAGHAQQGAACRLVGAGQHARLVGRHAHHVLGHRRRAEGPANSVGSAAVGWLSAPERRASRRYSRHGAGQAGPGQRSQGRSQSWGLRGTICGGIMSPRCSESGGGP